MKYTLTISLLIFTYAFAKAQSVEPNILQNLKHQDDVSNADLSITNVNGTPLEGSIMYDAPSEQVYIYTSNEWRRVFLAPKVENKTADYTLTASDDGNVLTFSGTTDVTLTVPAGLDIAFNVSVYQLGTGKVTIASGAGATVNNRLQRFVIAGLNAGIGIICTAANTYHVTGDLKKS